MLDDLDLSSIMDERMRTVIVRLLNIIVDQATALREAQAEIQRLRDEINRLKGEQGKPDITPPTPPANTWTTRACCSTMHGITTRGLGAL